MDCIEFKYENNSLDKEIRDFEVLTDNENILKSLNKEFLSICLIRIKAFSKLHSYEMQTVLSTWTLTTDTGIKPLYPGLDSSQYGSNQRDQPYDFKYTKSTSLKISFFAPQTNIIVKLYYQ